MEGWDAALDKLWVRVGPPESKGATQKTLRNENPPSCREKTSLFWHRDNNDVVTIDCCCISGFISNQCIGATSVCVFVLGENDESSIDD